MSVLSPKRVILFLAAALAAAPLFANHPSPRNQPRMAFHEQGGYGVLFGGTAPADAATGLTHASTETWLWTNAQWQQVFPASTPPGRSAHAMVYDSARNRVLLFGGRKEATVVRGKQGALDDLWAWHDGNWESIDTANHPPAREFPGMAYDRERDRVVLFGGYSYGADGKTLTPLKDTWEFDGTNWTQVSDNGPESLKPVLAFDAVRHETVMLGSDTQLAPLMFRWNPTAKTWDSMKPAALPACAFDASLTYDAQRQGLVVAGGVCSGTTPLVDEAWFWDGSNWTKLAASSTTRLGGAATTFDTTLGRVVRYGGSSNFGQNLESFTESLRGLTWVIASTSAIPTPRSRLIFRRDPDRDTIWMYGGLAEFSFTSTTAFYNGDFWRYRDGLWSGVLGSTATTPSGCVSPLSAYDTERDVLVAVCEGSQAFEWDGVEWKTHTVTKSPESRRFAGLAYDETIKKTVLFGGYDTLGNYRDDTWTWDGTNWTQVKPKTKPENRGQMAMWYDPLAKKTLIYSGVGRPNIDEHVTRFEDMWSFDGTNWAKVSVSGTTPGIRFGAQYAIDPRSQKLLLFGGLRATIDPENSKNVDQFYTNDLWEWDGSAMKWTELHPTAAPPPRQNGAFDFDSASGKFVLFGGFAGNFYLSDTWLYDGQTWTPVEAPLVNRRRSARK